MCYVCYISTRDHAERAEKSESNGAHRGRERDAFPSVSIRVVHPKYPHPKKFVVKKPPGSSSSHLFCSIRERDSRDSERDTFARAHAIHTTERERYGETRCVVVARFVRVTERVTEIDAFFLSFFLRVTDELIQTRE